MTDSTQIPLVMGPAGPIATPPLTLQQALITGVASTNPGYTANLPGSLIEDISSTDVGALAVMDQARVDAINSVTPNGANAFVLAQLGAQAGIAQGVPTNGSVFVQFTGTPGYVISPGFIVSDGTNQYVIQDGGIVETGGQTTQLFAVATNAGTFPIPADTVNQLVTSVASSITLSVTNPEAGTPAAGSEGVQSYRSRVLLAGLATATGTPALLKTLLYAITGVQQRLVAIGQTGSGWQVICGGGDSYAVASAILQAVPDISSLQGSQLAITAMTNANPVVISTNLGHGFIPGQTLVVAGATPAAFNGTYTVASTTATTITTTTNGSAFGAYIGGAHFSPGPRDVKVSIFQNPDTYTIPFVNPPLQEVTVAVTWNTNLPSFTAGASVDQLAAVAIQSYINSIFVAQPINLLEMNAVFQKAVASVIDASNITTLSYVVTVNGVAVAPPAGTSIIASDPESYFFCAANGVTVNQA
jgi:hypothetical protein